VDLPEAFPAVASSLSAIRRAVRAYADRAGAPPEVTAAAVLAVDEAATNAIVHGYEGGASDKTVHVSAEREGTWLRFAVGDDGTGLRPRRHSPGMGLGFAVIAQCADELALHEKPGGGIVVTMAFRLPG
jgi:anti-sigma regulatory factor (Ser/Thr protein kinase)